MKNTIKDVCLIERYDGLSGVGINGRMNLPLRYLPKTYTGLSYTPVGVSKILNLSRDYTLGFLNRPPTRLVFMKLHDDEVSVKAYGFHEEKTLSLLEDIAAKTHFHLESPSKGFKQSFEEEFEEETRLHKMAADIAERLGYSVESVYGVLALKEFEDRDKIIRVENIRRTSRPITGL